MANVQTQPIAQKPKVIPAVQDQPEQGGNGIDSRPRKSAQKDAVSEMPGGIAALTKAYGEGAEFTAERLKVLMTAYSTYARGFQEMQQTYADLVHRSMELTQRATRELIRCTSVTDMADAQRDLLREGMDEFFQGSAKILKASSKAVDDVVKPIQDQLRQMT